MSHSDERQRELKPARRAVHLPLRAEQVLSPNGR